MLIKTHQGRALTASGFCRIRGRCRRNPSYSSSSKSAWRSNEFPVATSRRELHLGSMKKLLPLIVSTLALAACMPERYRVTVAAENQANRWVEALGCGLGGASVSYLEKVGDIHIVNVCDAQMLCKKDDVATADGYTCVHREAAPARWRAVADGGADQRAELEP